MQTYGEKLVADLLAKLPPNEYFSFAEPHIANTNHSSHTNPDFVIVSARLGVIVLEVKDWVKIKRLNQNEVEVEQRDGKSDTHKNPIRIAREYTLNLADKFKQRAELVHKNGPHAGNLVFPWRYAVALPNIDIGVIQQAESADVWDRGSVLAKSDLTLENFPGALTNIPGAYKLDRYLNNTILDIIRGVINPPWKVLDSAGNDIGTLTPPQVQLIDESIKVVTPAGQKQLSLLDSQLPEEAAGIIESVSVRLVRGVAGSGKSLVLARRAQYLHQHYPELSILVVTYNVDLANDLKERIGEDTNLEVTNFHKMCSRIMGKTWPRDFSRANTWLKGHDADLVRDSGFSLDFVAEEIAYRKDLGIYDSESYLNVDRFGRGQALSKAKRMILNQIFEHYLQYQHNSNAVDWADVPRLTLQLLEPGHPSWHHYDVIMLDEAQDFAPSWINVIKALLKPNASLFMCEDPTQSIFRFSTWRQKGVEVAGFTKKLTVPFRSTKAISEAAHGLIHGDPFLNRAEESIEANLTSYELPEGTKPLLVHCSSQADEIKYVEQQVQVLLAGNVPPKQVAILCHSKQLTDRWQHLRDKGIYVESFWKMKGLEFQAVLIPQLQEAFTSSGTLLDEAMLSEIRRRIFTAMTRARETLVLSYYGQFTTHLEALTPYVQQVFSHSLETMKVEQAPQLARLPS